MSSRILVVDDEVEVYLSLAEVLRDHGCIVEHSSDPQRVIPLLEEQSTDLLILDVRMPSIGGIDLLQRVRRRFDDLPIIMISGYASIEDAVRSMKYGALNFYTKPVPAAALVQEIRNLELSRGVRSRRRAGDTLVTRNAQMREILANVDKAAPTDASVVLTGESGTGKELVADLLHRGSGRAADSYVKVNCAAVPENLLESEMFGYEKGAFTDARERRKGKVEAADGGTLFLDEIGDMSLSMQAKLLRVLQDRQFTRLGGTEAIGADFRIIAATNRDLTDRIRKGTFREDLYYRISVITIKLPPLRERPEDVVPLAESFLEKFNAAYRKQVRGFSPEVVEVLEHHDWPGNVRELKNIVERAIIFCETDTIAVSDLPEQYRIARREPQGTSPSLEDVAVTNARAVILEALKQSNGLKGEAARKLNITRKTLYNRMKKLNLA